MGICFVRDKSGIFDSFNCRFVEPANLFISKEAVKEYLKEHPFPKDENYSQQDLLNDLETMGSWTLVNEIKDETGNYIAGMIYELL